MNKNKILIIEDDAEISRLTSLYLEAEGFDTHVIHHGSEALDGIKTYQPHLMILDFMLPGINGIEICKQSRDFYQGPILILTACDDDVSEVSLLKLGADDFLTKPLKPLVLVARIEALLRRTNKTQSESKNKHSQLEIDSKKQVAFFRGKELALTGAELELLILLEQNIGNPVSRDGCSKAFRGIIMTLMTNQLICVFVV